MLPLTALGLRVFGFNRWYTGLARATRKRAKSERDEMGELIVRRSLNALDRAVRHGLYSGNCLSRSLTLWWLLRCQGISPDLRIGVRQEDGQFQAHAWVEHKGFPLNEDERIHERYAVFEQAILPRGASLV